METSAAQTHVSIIPYIHKHAWIHRDELFLTGNWEDKSTWNRIQSVFCLLVSGGDKRRENKRTQLWILCQLWHENCLILNLIIAAYHPDSIYPPSKFTMSASFSSSLDTIAICFIHSHELNMYTYGEAFHISTRPSKCSCLLCLLLLNKSSPLLQM